MCHFLLVSIVSNEKSAIIQVQDLLNFLNLQGSVFSHIWKVFSCYFFGYFFNLALSPLFPGLNTNVRSYDKLPKVSEPSIFFFLSLFVSCPDWVISTFMLYSPLILFLPSSLLSRPSITISSYCIFQF